MIPTSRELIDAMDGQFDPADPDAQILRAAWLLCRLDDWVTPDKLINLRMIDDGYITTTSSETGDAALEELGIDVKRMVRIRLLSEVAEAYDDLKSIAPAIEQLADAYGAVRRTALVRSSERTRYLIYLHRARTDYDQLAALAERARGR